MTLKYYSQYANNPSSEYAIFLISLIMISQLNPNGKDFFAKRILEKEERRMSQLRQTTLFPPPVHSLYLNEKWFLVLFE